MGTSITYSSAYRILLASEFFMARRPVLDRDCHLAGNELLFCHAMEDAPPVDLHSASVIADVKQHGLTRVLGDHDAFLHVDPEALLNDTVHGLPQDRVVLTLMESEVAPAALINRMQELRAQGFRFALNVRHDSEEVHVLLPLVDTIRIDIRGQGPDDVAALCRLFQAQGKLLLAENVDTRADFMHCLLAGFHLFQGYHFAQPDLDPQKKLGPSQHAIIELMALLASDAESAEIEHCVKSDASLGLKLLRFANTPAISTHRIESLRQALMVVGRNQLQRWLQLLLYADSLASVHGMLPLLSLAATRGRLLELTAQRLKPLNRGVADTAFTVGIMSLMETLFSLPLPDILRQLPVVDEVRDALLTRTGFFGDLLKLAEYSEWVNHDGSDLLAVMQRLRLSHSELYALQLAAFEWSDQVTRSLH
jgi:EAL and modified HD-GYP domain-containing signal transduction protein